MSDKRISDCVAATALGASDLLLLTQGGVSKKVSISNFFSAVPVEIGDNTTRQTITSGAISTSDRVSLITVNASAYTLAAGIDGRTKEIVCDTYTAGTAVITVTDGAGFSSLTFNGLGQSATLKYIDSKWYVMNIVGATKA